ncbi:hypothetical protein [Chitinophaga ginsengisoli]|nr:hypothetical protein [Chitinophaga ginsengisoli]
MASGIPFFISWKLYSQTTHLPEIQLTLYPILGNDIAPKKDIELLMGPIPENYTDFLYWLKNQTENYWSQDPKTTTNEDKCPQWAYGAKWIGMSDE